MGLITNNSRAVRKFVLMEKRFSYGWRSYTLRAFPPYSQGKYMSHILEQQEFEGKEEKLLEVKQLSLVF